MTSDVYRQITPHWILRLLGAKAACFTVVNGGLRAETEKGDCYLISAESLSNESALEDGIFFSRLVLRTDKGRKTFYGLNKQDIRSLFDWLRKHWLAELAPNVAKIASEIQAILAKGYPRKSRIDEMEALARQSQSTFHKAPKPEWCPDTNVSPFTFVAHIANSTENDWSHLRQKYLDDQLTTYADFFDKVESKPLTKRQREACVVDEDNNLVLAGAGTGKTSTMVGRGGYLIESGQAQAADILMLAFANKAATEMQERIDHRLGSVGITANTFHKLGRDIIAKVEGQQPSLTPLAEDDKMLAWQVNQWFEVHLQSPDYLQWTLDYFKYHLYPETNPFDFESEGEYFEFILANDIRTLKGEAVKSLGECHVANYLFKQGIEYIYESPYEHHTANPLYRQYHPDFYLPEFGIYIEYFGVDRNGNTAPYIDREKYHQGINWKRMIHKAKGTLLMELFHYEMQEDSLFDSIDNQLAEFGVTYDPLPPEVVLKTLRDFGAVSNFAVLLADLLKRYRANCYEAGQIEAAVKQAKNPSQVTAALKLLRPIVHDYQTLLDRQGHIDFDDMIGKALTYVSRGYFRSPWRYILVDEFQDISDPRARLIKYLRASVKDCSLFCVGDDWQAIYRFTGSDLAFTTQFNEKFGTTRVTALDLTFRFNNSISDIATRFVLQNPAQVPKQLNTLRDVDGPAVSLLRSDNRKDKKNKNEPGQLGRILSRLSLIAKPGSRVYLLARYGFNLPDRGDLKRLQTMFPKLEIECHTIHGSKGKEADYVVVLGLETGKHGFPSQRVTHPLLEALLPPIEAYEFAEERRLFYVALTRAKHRVYLVTDMAIASEFLVELLKRNYPIELDEFETSLAQRLFHLIKCLKCKTGTMVPRESHHGHFFGCNKFPLCNHKERGCPKCQMNMHRVDRFKVCLDPECGSWVPICPKCGAEMVKRSGVKGEFWGCRNYRREGACCTHTENVIVFDEILPQVSAQ